MLSSTLYRFLHLGLVFLAHLFIANILHPANFGTFSLLIVNASLITLLTGLGSESIILHKLTNDKWSIDQSHSFLWFMTAVQLALFMAGEWLSFSIRGVSLLAGDSGNLLIAEFFYFCGLIIVEKFTVLLYPVRLAGKLNFSLFLTSIIFLGFVYLFYAREKTTLNNFVWLLAIYSLLQGVVLMILFYSYQKPGQLRFMMRSYWPAVRMSLIVMFANLVQLFAYRIDYWFIKGFHQNHDVGIYAQANKIANLLWILPNIISLLLVPRLSGFSKTEIHSTFRLCFLFNIITTAVTVVAGWFIFQFLLSAEYYPGFRALLYMLPGYFFWVMVLYYATVFSWKGEFKWNLYGSILCLLVILISDWLLIPSLSFLGAAIANSVAYILVFGFYTILISKLFSFSFADLFSFKSKDLPVLQKLIREKS